MDIVNNFSKYLIGQKNPPSRITIKNYLSDIRKFTNWYENTTATTFTPEMLTIEIISAYQTAINSGINASLPAARSAKRYLSSLRKFACFLEQTGTINKNPFNQPKQIQKIADPFYFKEFKNFLYSEHASNLTIKNYMADIKQFLQWLEQVTTFTNEAESSTLLDKIDNFALEEYKTRLYKEMHLSPLSINRKLSSLRRYIRWLGEKNVINAAFIETSIEVPEKTISNEVVKTPFIDLPLTALQGIAEEKGQEEPASYSPFAPLRLFQKTTKLISLGSDLLFFNPIADIFESIHFSLLKKGKKKIFAPVSSILQSSTQIPKDTFIKTIIPKGASILPPRSANLDSVLTKIAHYQKTNNPEYVKNFTKALYAPLKISTKHMPWKEKLLFNIKYIRPNWYKKYHTFSFVTYLHFAIVIITAMISGMTLYQTWNEPIKHNPAVLAEQSQAPPRTLSFQGRLLNNNNTPITAETPLRFTLYNSPTATGAAKLWQESQNIKPNHNGYFTATLGEFNRIDQSLFSDNASLYIGISVNGNKELTPRQEIPTANYAANSQTVQGLKPITDSPDLAQNVLLALDSSGNLTIGGTSTHTFQATGGQFSLSGQALLLTTNPGSNGNIQINPDGSGIIDLQKPIQNTSNNITPSGVLGAVEIDDILSILATSSSQSALIVNQNGTGDIISARRNGLAKLRLDGAGNEYLSGNLILNGDTIGTNSTSFDIAGSTVTDLTIGRSASVISLGKSSGVTSINNSLSVRGTSTLNGPINTFGLLTANAGITIASGSGSLTLSGFTPGAIPFIDANSQVVQDANSFSWDDTNKQLKITSGSLCVIQDSNGVCNPSGPKGTIYASNTTITHADLAENYVSSQNLEPGDVVVIEGKTNNDAIVKSSLPYQPELLGIVSTQPGITLNTQAETDSQHPHVYPLALSGRVPVKVSSINGTIQPGDDLTSSTIPGVAMKAVGPGQIIGKALEAYTNPDASSSSKIMAFVNLTYRTNETTLTDKGNFAIASQSGDLQNSSNTTPTEIAGLEQQLGDAVSSIKLNTITAQTIITQSLTIATDQLRIDGQTLKDYITGIVEQIINQELDKRFAQFTTEHTTINKNAPNSTMIKDQTASTSATSAPTSSTSASLQNTTGVNASASATTATNSAFAIYNSIASTSATASIAAIPTPLEDHVDATKSATVPNQELGLPNSDIFNSNNNQYASFATASGQLTYIPNFKSDFATFTQGLIALGPTSMTDAAVSDMLTINNNLKLTQNSLDTIGSDLNIQPLRQGNISFMGGLVSIDTQGNLKVSGDALFAQNVTVNGQLSAGIIAPVPDQNLVINLKNKANNAGSSLLITNATGSAALQINQAGDVLSSGAATFGSVISNGLTIVRGAQADTSTTQTIANGSAGKGVIEPFETERTILTPFVTEHSLIYITATSNTGTLTPYLARQTVEDPTKGTKGSFTVAIPTQATAKISFNWWIVN